jgi:hypothetical protein
MDTVGSKVPASLDGFGNLIFVANRWINNGYRARAHQEGLQNVRMMHRKDL